jgi:nucleoside-diphosphate-sugar epimerase
MKLALTGGTGFVGAHVIDAALAADHQVTALTRRAQPGRDGLTWVAGDLADRAALAHLVEGADAVIHVAGVLKAHDAAGFEAGNVAGTQAVLAAAERARTTRFVHVSSLAAREPQLSLYGGSKARAEKLVEESSLDWAIVRPPAVYGPGDRETLDLFRMAKLGLVVVPARGRLSIIHVGDLAALLLALSDAAAPRRIMLEPDDGRRGGWTQREFAKVLGRAVGSRPLILPAGRRALNLASWIDRFIRRDNARLTPDRAAYFSHPDWVADPRHAISRDLWRPRFDTIVGLRATADWYRSKGWL